MTIKTEQEFPVASIEMDAALRVVYVNDWYCSLAQCAKENIIGKPWAQGLDEGCHQMLKSMVKKSLHHPACRFEVTFKGTPEPIWAICQLKSYKDSSGKVSIYGTLIDITDLKKRKRKSQSKQG